MIARFGRYPHRNGVLGRTSTAEELEYLRTETPVHMRAALFLMGYPPSCQEGRNSLYLTQRAKAAL